MDKSWMQRLRWTAEYRDGLEKFLDRAFEKASEAGKILCPCSSCGDTRWGVRDIVLDHLICEGFLPGYTIWYFHGEAIPSSTSRRIYCDGTPSYAGRTQHEPNTEVDVEGLLRDAFIMHDQVGDDFPPTSAFNECNQTDGGLGAGNEQSQTEKEPTREAGKFYKLMKDMSEPLYDGSKYSKLSFSIRFFQLKCEGGMSKKAFDSLCQFLRDVFPFAAIPESSYHCKKFIKDLGFGYEKIHSCLSDCILYWGDNADRDDCPICECPRWLGTNSLGNFDEDDGEPQTKKKPRKILHYFPLIPRLQRLFMSSKTLDSMQWYHEGRTKDGELRHPADALAWKLFDSRFPDFAADPRNVRLGLASDGFNPFKMMSTSYSTWPVVLIPYNLPPWIGMKQQSFLLSMIIPGEKGPGNDIDIYLQPFIKELMDLWEGVETYDASRKENFRLRAALLWTINDFPAYANLSGWSTKGKYACPCCAGGTNSLWLNNGRKFCYMAHRRWLDVNHAFRRQGSLFDGTQESRVAPTPTIGSDILSMLQGVNFEYGKKHTDAQTKKKVKLVFEYGPDDHPTDDGHVRIVEDDEEDNPNEVDLWKKRSIFFDLPYWQYNILHHNLDVMHIEKNVGENIISTILNVDKKTKDNLNSRRDLKEMGIWEDLHPIEVGGRIRMPPACFGMSKEEKKVFHDFLKDIRVPDGYALNISRCVNVKERKLFFLKSHDHHILMHDLLPIALRSSMSTKVTRAIIELCNIFKSLSGKILNVAEVDRLEDRAAVTLCHLEKIFPPSFFTIMVHLVIHLPLEAKFGGPVY